ncbi:autolysin [Parachaetomium inaequale]|uniref:Autolysin n=1 Tax=Parachaetomium inaequale TaxID=2588326 RepID=A0AAN6PIG6_9PEZI|nr:autolysin [Parachaetomium inaequale]
MRSLRLLLSSLGICLAAPAAAPTPTQAGIAANCNKFHLVASGDTCGRLSVAYAISLPDFYSWNPAVDDACTGLWLGYYVCVGVEASATPTTTATPTIPTGANGVATPSPIREGMTTVCDTFHFAVAGDNCWDLEQTYGVTFKDFYRWNPSILNSCGGLWPGYHYCIGVIPGVPEPTVTHTPPAVPVVTPEPYKDGMTPYCNKFHFAEKDRMCDELQALYGITREQIVNWNPNILSMCGGMWKDVWYCVGIY